MNDSKRQQESISDPEDKASSTNPPPQRRPLPIRLMFSTLRIAVVTYLLMLVVLVVMESRLVYPGAYQSVAAASGLNEWKYETADGTELIGRRLARPGADRTLLYFHGNGRTVQQLDRDLVDLANRFDCVVLAAEYRGFQQSDVTPNEENMIADSLAAHDAACNQFGLVPDELILFGRSLGGGCAAAVAGQRGTSCLILDRTFDSAINVAASVYPVFPIRMLMRNQYNSVVRLADYRGDLIQIHGTVDEVIPVTHGRRLFDQVPTESKLWIEVPDLLHNDPIPESVYQRIRERIEAKDATKNRPTARSARFSRLELASR